jgi:hypothetical protein
MFSHYLNAALILRASCGFDQDQTSPGFCVDFDELNAKSALNIAYFASILSNTADECDECEAWAHFSRSARRAWLVILPIF